jgi:hypothetical protein
MAGFATYSEEWNDLVSSTSAHMVPGVFRQTITDHPVLSLLTGNQKEITGMGKQIEFVVSFGDNESVQFITNSAQSFTYTPSSVLTKGYVTPSLLVGHILYLDEEQEQNSSDEQIASLVEERMAQLKETFDRKMARAVYSNGNLDGKPATKGLKFWVPTNPGSLTIAGLSESDKAWWKSQHRGSCGDWATNGWGGSSANHVLNMFIRISDGSRKPKLIISDAGVFEKFHAALLSDVQITSPQNFQAYGSGDSIPILGTKYIWDKDCDSGTMLMLHPEDFRFYVSPGMNFKLLPMMRIPNQPLVQFQFMSFRHELVCTRRNRQARLSGWNIPS